MTDDLREALARHFWRRECLQADTDERRERRDPPKAWADPWHESGTGVRQQRRYYAEADACLAFLAEYVRREDVIATAAWDCVYFDPNATERYGAIHPDDAAVYARAALSAIFPQKR